MVNEVHTMLVRGLASAARSVRLGQRLIGHPRAPRSPASATPRRALLYPESAQARIVQAMMARSLHLSLFAFPMRMEARHITSLFLRANSLAWGRKVASLL